MSKENFKAFARIHPELANHVLNGEVTWQKLYELYDNLAKPYIYIERYRIRTKHLNDK